MRDVLQFRMSTMLCLIALVAVLLGWGVDHYRLKHDQIVGVWYYPPPDVIVHGYSERLTIRRDGTFTRVQRFGEGYGRQSFDGTYVVSKNGMVRFHATVSKLTQFHPGLGNKPKKIDVTFPCRAAIDVRGNLILSAIDHAYSDSDRQLDGSFAVQGYYSAARPEFGID